MDPLQRLREMAEKFHSKADKRVPLGKFVAKLGRVQRMKAGRRRKARQYAAHVAAWLAFASPAYVPGATDMHLLDGFLLEVGGGKLPPRLQQILPVAQRALARVRLTDLAGERAREKLEERLHHFSCCRSAQSPGNPDHGLPEQEEEESEVDEDEEDPEVGQEESEADGDEEDPEVGQQASTRSDVVLLVDSSMKLNKFLAIHSAQKWSYIWMQRINLAR